MIDNAHYSEFHLVVNILIMKLWQRKREKENAFMELARLAQNKRIVVVLDEFTYVMDANTEVPSIIQKVWDHHLRKL